jgi:hypothetical protein
VGSVVGSAVGRGVGAEDGAVVGDGVGATVGGCCRQRHTTPPHQLSRVTLQASVALHATP